MINLDDTILKNFHNSYLDLILPVVLSKMVYPLAPKLNEINEFTDERVYDFLKQKNSNAEVFIKDLLTLRVSELCDNYPEVNEYFETVKFLNHVETKFKNEMKALGNGNFKKRKDERQNVFLKHGNNSWIQKVKQNHPDYYLTKDNFKALIKEIHNALNKLNENIKWVINYNFLNPSAKHKVKNAIGVEVCPYCNRNFTSKFDDKGVMKNTADLDHFYNQSQLQLFSLSLYNFIPSCQVCNSRFKLDKFANIIHPFIEKVDYSKLKFDYTLTDSADSIIAIGDIDKFNITIECLDDRYVEHLNLFQLKSIYNSHKQYVSEILFKKTAFNDTYVEMTNKFLGELNVTDTEKNIILYGIEMNESEFHKKPLSKLTFDLINK